MPCVVPTCASTEGTFKLFPRHDMLSERWLEAIQVGTGTGLQIAENCELSQSEICEWHFTTLELNQEDYCYQEPALFTDSDGEYVEISSCRLCLHFYPRASMVSRNCVLGENDTGYMLNESLKLCAQEVDFLEMICEECLARIDILNSIQAFFAEAEVEYKELGKVAKNASQEVHSTVKLQHPSVDAFIEEERADTTPEPDDFIVMDVNTADWEPVEPDFVAVRERPRKAARRASGKCKIVHNRKKRSKEQVVRSAALKAVVGRKCYICVTVLSDANELLSHLTELHATKTDYHCEECSLDFPQVTVFNRHLSRHDCRERPHKCSFCALHFCSPLQKKIHENKVHGVENDAKQHAERMRINICETCGRTFKYKSKLNTHIKTAHKRIEVPTCNICNKNFTAKSSLERHMLLHTNEKPHNCSQCKASFRRLLDLRFHINKVHEGKNPHICTECNQEFNNYHALYLHKQHVHLKKNPTATQFKPYHLICQLCKLPNKKSDELAEHIQVDHPDEVYPYAQCPDCPRTFLSKQHLAYHKEIHTDKYACSICGQRNATVQRLQAHLENKHSEVRKYDCPVCITKSYKTAAALRRHVMSHTKGKTFKCDFCEKAFMRKDQMVIHRRIHTGEKPFQCAFCLKRFSDDATFCKHKKRCQYMTTREDVEITDLLESDF